MTERTKEIEDQFVERISLGEPLAAICRAIGIGRTTVYDWQHAEDGAEFSERIARARLDGFDAIADRARLTARGKDDTAGGDSTADVQRDKLIIETDLKLLAKWDPRRYGDKTLLGSDPDNPLPTGFDVRLVGNGKNAG